MTQYIVVFVFFLLAMILMLSSLKFSKYKEREGSSCGGDDCACDAAGKDPKDCNKIKDFEDKISLDIDNMEKT